MISYCSNLIQSMDDFFAVLEELFRPKCQSSGLDVYRDVGSISNLGAGHFEGTFSSSKRGHFLTMKRALLCLLQNLGPGFTSINVYAYLSFHD